MDKQQSTEEQLAARRAAQQQEMTESQAEGWRAVSKLVFRKPMNAPMPAEGTGAEAACAFIQRLWDENQRLRAERDEARANRPFAQAIPRQSGEKADVFRRFCQEHGVRIVEERILPRAASHAPDYAIFYVIFANPAHAFLHGEVYHAHGCSRTCNRCREREPGGPAASYVLSALEPLALPDGLQPRTEAGTKHWWKAQPVAETWVQGQLFALPA